MAPEAVSPEIVEEVYHDSDNTTESTSQQTEVEVVHTTASLAKGGNTSGPILAPAMGQRAPRVAPPAAPVQPPAKLVQQPKPDPQELAIEHGRQSLSSTGLGAIGGQLTAADLGYPKLKLTQFIGPAAQAGFTPGSLVVADSCIIYDPTQAPDITEVHVTIVKAMKQYMEQVDWGDDRLGQVFSTLEEAQAAGFVTDWGPNGEKPEVLAQLVCLVLIEYQPGMDDSEFTIEIGDKLFALAIWRLSGVSYSLIKAITAAQRTRLREGLHTGSFRLASKLVTGGRNQYYVPTLLPGSKHDPEFVAEVINLCAEE